MDERKSRESEGGEKNPSPCPWGWSWAFSPAGCPVLRVATPRQEVLKPSLCGPVKKIWSPNGSTRIWLHNFPFLLTLPLWLPTLYESNSGLLIYLRIANRTTKHLWKPGEGLRFHQGGACGCFRSKDPRQPWRSILAMSLTLLPAWPWEGGISSPGNQGWWPSAGARRGRGSLLGACILNN